MTGVRPDWTPVAKRIREEATTGEGAFTQVATYQADLVIADLRSQQR